MSEAPSYQSFSIVSGNDLRLQFTVVDRNGSAVDLTGGSGRFAMARNQNASTVVDSSSGTATVTIQDAATGRVDVVISDTTLDPLNGDYYYEFEWVDSTSRTVTVARGVLTVDENLI
jgi:hypothetical protein